MRELAYRVGAHLYLVLMAIVILVILAICPSCRTWSVVIPVTILAIVDAALIVWYLHFSSAKTYLEIIVEKLFARVNRRPRYYYVVVGLLFVQGNAINALWRYLVFPI